VTPEDIRPLLAVDPFEKFYLNVSDGSSYEVGEPAQVSFTASGGAVEYEAKGRRTLIALSHLVSITFASTAGDPFFLRGK
jgi:hypothetical protein